MSPATGDGSAKSARPDDSATRERLLGAARALISSKGFAATSTREIAAAAGCNVSMIAHYFGSKDGLLRELLVAHMSGPGGELRALAQSTGTFASKIERFVDYMVDKLARDHQFMTIVHREVINGGNPELLAEFGHIIGGNVAVLVGLVQEARAAGELRADLDPRLACLTLMGMMQFYFINLPIASRLLGPPTTELLAQLKKQVVATFLGGVLAARPAGPAVSP